MTNVKYGENLAARTYSVYKKLNFWCVKARKIREETYENELQRIKSVLGSQKFRVLTPQNFFSVFWQQNVFSILGMLSAMKSFFSKIYSLLLWINTTPIAKGEHNDYIVKSRMISRLTQRKERAVTYLGAKWTKCWHIYRKIWVTLKFQWSDKKNHRSSQVSI